MAVKAQVTAAPDHARLGWPGHGEPGNRESRPCASAAGRHRGQHQAVVRCRARYHIPPGPVAGISWDTARAPAAYASGAGSVQRGHLATRTRRRPGPARSAAGGLRAARCQRSVPIWPAGPRRLGRVERLAALPGRKMQPPGRRRSLLRSRRSRPAARCRASPAALCHNADDFLARFLIRACPIEKGAPCRWHSIRRAVRRPGRSCGHRCLHGRSFRAALAVGLGEVGGRTLIASVERGR
jgi:hypothetical protein